MKAIVYTTTLLLLLATTVMAKRIAPKEVPSIKTDKAVFSVPHFPGRERSQNGGVIEAHHPETKELLWRVTLYKTVYDETLEGDVQDVFITTLSFDKAHNLLIASDEMSRVFVLDVGTQKVTQVRGEK
jgi:hypothetical protein